jgi:mono/diheme cytochrome c family protein
VNPDARDRSVYSFPMRRAAAAALTFATALSLLVHIPAATAAVTGVQIYSQRCSSCHQADGMGTPNVFPPLARNPDVTGPAKPPIHAVLYGLSGRKIHGKTYAMQMPAWKATLSDADVAAVVTYIRSSFGNRAPAVTPADVAKISK